MTTTTAGIPGLDTESCYSAVKSRDRRFDGVFYIAVRTTGIYCRPSCPARTPALQNVTFHRSAAAAQAAGYRACKRCLPDATPGSPDWDAAATVAGRAMRLIADGVVDRDGVDGLAQRLGYTTRHLSRVLAAELGAGPLALARAQRAQTARVLVETTDLSFADIAFASGFASVRQFNDTVREVYAATPTQLRGRRGGARTPGAIELRLAVRTPFAGSELLRYLAVRAVEGVEVAGDGWYARTLDLPHGPGTVRIELGDVLDPGQTALVPARFVLHDLRDTSARGRAGPAAARRRLRPDRRRRPLHRRPADRPARTTPPRPARPRSCRRRRDRGPRRARPAGERGRRPHCGGAARRRARTAVRHRHPRPDPPVPRRRDGRGARPRAAADAASSRPRPDRPRRGPGRRRRRARPRPRPRRRTTGAAGAARHRPLDGRLHRPAGPRPPRHLPADRRRRAQRTHRARSCRRRSDHPIGWAPWRSYALLHLWTSLEENS